jgi:hypothetical protein
VLTFSGSVTQIFVPFCCIYRVALLGIISQFFLQ